MPDITITIPSPVLTGSDYFKVRYRLIGGAYSAYQNETNTPFVLTGLAVGNYEMEIIYVKVDTSTSPPTETECPAVLRTFIITDEFVCNDWAAEIIQIGTQYILHITYNQVSPPADPACGWEILYTINGQTTTVSYATLPPSMVIDLTLPSNDDVTLNIRANLCNGNYQYCFSDDIPAIEPACTPFTNVTAAIRFLNGGYYLDVTYTGSVPSTVNLPLTFSQTNPVVVNPQFYSAVIPNVPTATPPAQTTFTVKLAPVPDPQFGLECVQYKGNIVDICGDVHYFCATYPAGCISCG